MLRCAKRRNMTNPAIEPLKKRLHDEEREIDALECKIRDADLRTAYPQEYDKIRFEQEEHRQQALRCKAEIDRQIVGAEADAPDEDM
jgi:predicted  nucleic acid-binding Zn-ribbon protein